MKKLFVAALSLVCLATAGCGSGHHRAGPTRHRPTPSATSGAVLGLDTDAHPAGTPLWGIEPPPGWRFTIVDQDGYNQAKGPHDCLLTSYQARIEDQVTSVREASTNITRNGAAALVEKARSARVADGGTTRFPSGLARNGPPVEFTWERIDYRHRDGRPFSTYVASRAFVAPATALQLVYACPTAYAGESAQALATMSRAGSVLFD